MCIKNNVDFPFNSHTSPMRWYFIHLFSIERLKLRLISSLPKVTQFVIIFLLKTSYLFFRPCLNLLFLFTHCLLSGGTKCADIHCLLALCWGLGCSQKLLIAALTSKCMSVGRLGEVGGSWKALMGKVLVVGSLCAVCYSQENFANLKSLKCLNFGNN